MTSAHWTALCQRCSAFARAAAHGSHEPGQGGVESLESCTHSPRSTAAVRPAATIAYPLEPCVVHMYAIAPVPVPRPVAMATRRPRHRRGGQRPAPSSRTCSDVLSETRSRNARPHQPRVSPSGGHARAPVRRPERTNNDAEQISLCLHAHVASGQAAVNLEPCQRYAAVQVHRINDLIHPTSTRACVAARPSGASPEREMHARGATVLLSPAPPPPPSPVDRRWGGNKGRRANVRTSFV